MLHFQLLCWRKWLHSTLSNKVNFSWCATCCLGPQPAQLPESSFTNFDETCQNTNKNVNFHNQILGHSHSPERTYEISLKLEIDRATKSESAIWTQGRDDATCHKPENYHISPPQKPTVLYKVKTSFHLVSSFFDTIQVSILNISIFLIPVRYGHLAVILFSIPFRYKYHARTLIPRQSCPSVDVV